MSDSKSGLLAKLANSVNPQGEISGVDSAAVQSLVDVSVNSLINSAPETLNTLDELAAALNDDANFATTVANSLATKASTSYVDSAVGSIQGFSGSYGDLTGVPFVLGDNVPKIHYTETQPIATQIGELWFDANENKWYRSVENPNTATLDNTQATVTGVSTINGGQTDTLPSPGGTSIQRGYGVFGSTLVFNTPLWITQFSGRSANPKIFIQSVTYEDGTVYNFPANTSSYSGIQFQTQRITQLSTTGSYYVNFSSYNVITAGAPIWQEVDPGYATDSDVAAAIANLVDAAPATLDTLNELAAALGDDANFATTVTNSLATKANSADVYTQAEVDSAVIAKANSADLATVATSGSYNDLTNLPDLSSSGGGTEVVADVNSLPTNPSQGDFAYVTGTNKLYLWNGSAWFNIAIVNQAPTAITGNQASYELAQDGTPTVVTLTSSDPEGLPLTWSATTSGDTQVGTVTNVDNVFTVTPSTDEADEGTLSVTFSVTDGSNTETSVSSFTLQFAIDWSTISEQAKIYPANHGDGDTFGESIDIDGDIAVVGAVGDDGEGNSYLSAGAAYVFTRSGSTWTEQAILRPSDISGGENFGHKVCVDGNTIAVSAPFKTVSGQTNAGAVYIYTTADNGATWTEQQKIVASNPGGADYFGHGLGLSGDLLVASAYQEDTYGSNAGSAYVFKRTGTTWAQQQQLGGADTAGNDQFGFSVAISNDTIAIGARSEDNDLVATVGNCGAVYVFTTSDNGSTWTQQDKFVSSTPTNSEQFGSAVDIHGDTIVVGAYQSNSQRGAGWIFTRSGSTWTQRVKLTPSVETGAYFGEQVAIDKENGNVVVIGAPREHISGVADVGCAFVYSTADGGLTWTEDKKITSSDGAASDYFGSSVGINGNTVMVGATHDDTPENYAGAAYIFTA